MENVIRLLGLPKIGGSGDIRRLFKGLAIPKGGVHILGGKLGEAFIIFETEDGARRALNRTGGIIKNSHIQLFPSSESELQDSIDLRFGDESKSDGGFDRGGKHVEPHASKPHYSGNSEITKPLTNEEKHSMYVILCGLPYKVTKDEVKQFFRGLSVVDVLLLKRENGTLNGFGLVKFGSIEDADAGLLHNNEYIGTRFITIKKATEKKWIKYGGQIEDAHEQIDREHSPKLGNHFSLSKKRSHSKSPRKQRARSRSPHIQQFYVHIKNVSYNVDKPQIKKFLGYPEMADSQIKFLLDKHKNRTREGFVMLQNEHAYEACLALHKGNLAGRPVFILPIERNTMLELLEPSNRHSIPKEDILPKNNINRGSIADYRSGTRKCMYVRNLPFDVTKTEVLNFFAEFPVTEDDIILLYDDRGVGLGEALVNFPSEQQAVSAESLNHHEFLGTEVLLRLISEEEKKVFGPCASAIAPPKKPRHYPDSKEEHSKSQHSRVPARHSLSDFRHGSGRCTSSVEDIKSLTQRDLRREAENFERFDMRHRNYSDDMPKPRFGGGSSTYESTTIHIKNLHLAATSEDVLDFFNGFRVIPDSVDIRYSKNGVSLGKASVCMESYDEAVAAVTELNEKPIGNRIVKLSIRY